MKIAHFDLGTNMAMSHNGCGDVIVTERFTSTGSRADRAAQTLAWLQSRKQQLQDAGIKLDIAHYERPFARGYDATRCGWGLAGLIEATFGADCVVLDSTPQSIKSFALATIGKKPVRKKMTSAERRKATADEKLLMIEVAQALGYYGDNEHEADAYLGLKYAEKFCVHVPPKEKT